MRGYYSAHLHLHSCFESSASIGGHCFQARRLGVDVVWLTDHDSKICWLHDDAIWGEDFEGQDLITPPLKDGHHGWEPSISEGIKGGVEISSEVHRGGNRSMHMWAKGNDGQTKVDFWAKGKKHQKSLLTGIKLQLALRPEGEFEKWGRLRIIAGLSQQPPDMSPAVLEYVFGDEGTEGTIERGSLKGGKWNMITLDLTGDALRYARGGMDNVFANFSLVLEPMGGERVDLYVDDFVLEQEYMCQDSFDQQKILARDIASQYGVTVHVGTEISRSGPHKNAFGSWIPILDRNARVEAYSEEEAILHVRAHGGAISSNHPFSRWKREELSPGDRKRIIGEVLADYLGRPHQTDLIEVGFPEGRQGLPIEDYLSLWDGLSMNGVVMGGIGVSDAHKNETGWDSGNNMVNYIRSDSTDEKCLVRGLLSGDVFMVDPIRFRGNLEFHSSNGHQMGEVVLGDAGSGVFKMEGCTEGWRFNWVVDGRRLEKDEISHTIYESEMDIQNSRFIRCEVWGSDGRCIVLSNPIYRFDTSPPGVPGHRIVACQ